MSPTSTPWCAPATSTTSPAPPTCPAQGGCSPGSASAERRAPGLGRQHGKPPWPGASRELEHGTVPAQQPASAVRQRQVDELLVIGVGAAHSAGSARQRNEFRRLRQLLP